MRVRPTVLCSSVSTLSYSSIFMPLYCAPRYGYKWPRYRRDRHPRNVCKGPCRHGRGWPVAFYEDCRSVTRGFLERNGQDWWQLWNYCEVLHERRNPVAQHSCRPLIISFYPLYSREVVKSCRYSSSSLFCQGFFVSWCKLVHSRLNDEVTRFFGHESR